jgi:hypothetical protein
MDHNLTAELIPVALYGVLKLEWRGDNLRWQGQLLPHTGGVIKVFDAVRRIGSAQM